MSLENPEHIVPPNSTNLKVSKAEEIPSILDATLRDYQIIE